MSSSSYTSEPTPGPFSLVEFGNLVAFALDNHTDRFSETCLQFDPDLLTAALGRATDTFYHCQDQYRVVHDDHGSSPSSRMRTSYTSCSPRLLLGPRQLLEKIKRQASAFVLRPAAAAVEPEQENRSPQPIPTVSPYNNKNNNNNNSSSIIHGCSSFFESDSDEENDDFVPYLPLASQYERAAAAAAAVVVGVAEAGEERGGGEEEERGEGEGEGEGEERAGGERVPDLKPKHTTTTSPNCNIFSRPSSSITSPAPSPRSLSISTTSSATEPYSPLTPTTPGFAPISTTTTTGTSPDHSHAHGEEEEYRNHRWSLCTDESLSGSSSYHQLGHHHQYGHQQPQDYYPFDDPFAKGSVQVVVRHYPQDGVNTNTKGGLYHRDDSLSGGARRKTTRRRAEPMRPHPTVRVPVRVPVPTTSSSSPSSSSLSPSSSPSSSESSSSLQDSHHPPPSLRPIETPCEWTLRLGVPILPGTNNITTTTTNTTTTNTTTTNTTPAASPRKVKQQSKPNPNPNPNPKSKPRGGNGNGNGNGNVVLRINVPKDDGYRRERGVEDWTLMLPLDLDLGLNLGLGGGGVLLEPRRRRTLERKPGTPDSTSTASASASISTSTASASTSSTVTVVPGALQRLRLVEEVRVRERERERERAFAVLTARTSTLPLDETWVVEGGLGEEGVQAEADADSIVSGTYYSARSSFSAVL